VRVSLCTLALRLSAVPVDRHSTTVAAPVAITVTEDNSAPVDDDDFVQYYGLQAYVEGAFLRLHFYLRLQEFV